MRQNLSAGQRYRRIFSCEIQEDKMKTLKFRKELAKLILQGKKKKTWRLFDDKKLKEDDIVLFEEWETEKIFAKAKLTKVKEITFKDINKKDEEGHEKFSSKEEMYKTYSDYYNKPINPETKLKVINFELLK
mgnify:CR=1 FL=1